MKYYKDIECIKTFLRYPGNKSKLLKKIIPYVPKDFETYYEPFLGSGAVFLAIQPKKAVLGDINKDVINVWKHVGKDPDKLYEICKKLTEQLIEIKDKKEQLKWAREKTKELNEMTNYNFIRAGLYLFLTQCVYNHNLRHKKKDEFYFHSLHTPETCKNYLMNKNLNIKLPTCDIYCQDYKITIQDAKENDFIYLDPPYIYETKNPIIYNKQNEEKNLINDIKDQMDRLTIKKVKVMISMSDFPNVRELFSNYKFINIKVYRGYTNSFSNELLILNY